MKKSVLNLIFYTMNTAVKVLINVQCTMYNKMIALRAGCKATNLGYNCDLLDRIVNGLNKQSNEYYRPLSIHSLILIFIIYKDKYFI